MPTPSFAHGKCARQLKYPLVRFWGIDMRNWDICALYLSVSLFTSERERRSWFWVAVVLVAIYSSLGPSQMLAEWLREHNLLRISLAATLLLGGAIIVWQWAKTRPGWSEIGVGFGVTFAYMWALARVGVPPEERTHLIEYAVIAAFMYRALVERRRNGIAVPAPDALTVLGTTLLGWLDEGIQWLLPNRVYDIRDVFFNFLAGVMFIFVALAIALVRKRRVVDDPLGPRWPDMLPRISILPRLAILAVPLGIAAYIGFGPQPLPDPMPRAFTIPIVDLATDRDRQIVVDREPGQYLGHPTTVLLNDNRSILAVYPKGHGTGGIVMKRSDDGGRTWSSRLPVPESWATSQEVPTVFPVVDPTGVRRLIMFSGLYPIRLAVSEDEGVSWSELEPIGNYGGIVAMASVAALPNGEHLAFWHDDGRFISGSGEPGPFVVYQARSFDGGLSWSDPESIARDTTVDLCEPGLVWSPDGTRMALLLRENSRTRNSYVIVSGDLGRTWSDPEELPAALTGDRHTARYAPDGRLFITFRDMAHESPTRGDWVGWVGTFDDIIRRTEGQYRIRLMDNTNAWDAAYPGLELLPNGTFVTTTYGHWVEGEEPFIVSIRFTMAELDAMVEDVP